MPNIVHKVGIDAPMEKVFDAISTVNGLKGWWTEHTEGEDQVGGKINFRFPETGPTMEVLELASPEFIKWKCVDGVDQWKDTICIFELDEKDGQTDVMFSQNGWEDETDLFAHCSTKWATFMLSLKEFCESGKGKAYPNDVKIGK